MLKCLRTNGKRKSERKKNTLGSYKHRWTCLSMLQVSQITSQHHLNRQLQFMRSIMVVVTNPRPQQSNSHPSTPGEVALHSRPEVPSEPVSESAKQKFGDSSE